MGTGRRIDKREKRVETTGEGIKNGTTQEENYSIGPAPLITATEFVQNGYKSCRGVTFLCVA